MATDPMTPSATGSSATATASTTGSSSQRPLACRRGVDPFESTRSAPSKKLAPACAGLTATVRRTKSWPVGPASDSRTCLDELIEPAGRRLPDRPRPRRPRPTSTSWSGSGRPPSGPASPWPSSPTCPGPRSGPPSSPTAGCSSPRATVLLSPARTGRPTRIEVEYPDLADDLRAGDRGHSATASSRCRSPSAPATGSPSGGRGGPRAGPGSTCRPSGCACLRRRPTTSSCWRSLAPAARHRRRVLRAVGRRPPPVRRAVVGYVGPMVWPRSRPGRRSTSSPRSSTSPTPSWSPGRPRYRLSGGGGPHLQKRIIRALRGAGAGDHRDPDARVDGAQPAPTRAEASESPTPSSTAPTP